MILFACGVALGIPLGAIASGFFWAQFIYSNTKRHEERGKDVR